MRTALKHERMIKAEPDKEHSGYAHIAIAPLVNGRMGSQYDGSIRLNKEGLASFIRMLTAIHAELD